MVGFAMSGGRTKGINDAGHGMMKECVREWVCVFVLVVVCGWGGAMLMSAPFYSLTSRSNYLAYPGSSINVFQPPTPH